MTRHIMISSLNNSEGTDVCFLAPAEPYCWVDMHDGGANYDAGGEYSTALFGARAVDVVEQHAAAYGGGGDGATTTAAGGGAMMTKPLFLYFAPTTIHSPTMVPEAFWDAQSDALDAIGNYARKLVAAEV